MTNTLLGTLGVILAAIAGSTGLWGTVQLLINRSGRKAEAARAQSEQEKATAEAKKAEAERIALLAEVERKAYAAAEESANRRYAALEEDYDRCRGDVAELRHDNAELRSAVEPLIEAIAAIMARVTPSNGTDVNLTVTGAEIATVRTAVREARRHLN